MDCRFKAKLGNVSLLSHRKTMSWRPEAKWRKFLAVGEPEEVNLYFYVNSKMHAKPGRR